MLFDVRHAAYNHMSIEKMYGVLLYFPCKRSSWTLGAPMDASDKLAKPTQTPIIGLSFSAHCTTSFLCSITCCICKLPDNCVRLIAGMPGHDTPRLVVRMVPARCVAMYNVGFARHTQGQFVQPLFSVSPEYVQPLRVVR